MTHARGWLAAVAVLGLAVAAGAADKGKGKPATRAGRANARAVAASQPTGLLTVEQAQRMRDALDWRRTPGVPEDANGFPSGPLPPLNWKLNDKATDQERGSFASHEAEREKFAKIGADRTVRYPKEIAAAKAGKIDPRQKEPNRVAKDGTFTFKSEADRAAHIAQTEKGMAIATLFAWQSYDPDFLPGVRPESVDRVAHR